MAEREISPIAQEEVAIGYNPQGVNGFAVLIWGLLIIGTIVAVYFGVKTYWVWFNEREFDRKVQQPVAEDAAALRAREEGELTRYRWLDKGKGRVGLPVNRAMELTAQSYASGTPWYPAKPVNKAQIDAANSGAAAGADGGGAAPAAGAATPGSNGASAPANNGGAAPNAAPAAAPAKPASH